MWANALEDFLKREAGLRERIVNALKGVAGLIIGLSPVKVEVRFRDLRN